MATPADNELKPDCDICGQPYHRHDQGAFRFCPVAAVSYRPKATSDNVTKQLADALEEARSWMPNREEVTSKIDAALAAYKRGVGL